ncbi:hypothetical protein GS881_24495 [Rhodococcus hoagii]|nr:hypothetical protein [Prescottella equi]
MRSWPARNDLTHPYATDVEGLPNTLTISITGDPTTPYPGGVSLADTLGGSLLTGEGEQHAIAMSGINECVNTIVIAYLTDLRHPRTGLIVHIGLNARRSLPAPRDPSPL